MLSRLDIGATGGGRSLAGWWIRSTNPRHERHEATAVSKADPRAGAPLSDRGELGASEFRIHQEAERIQELALLHQLHQNRLPELS
jgi:hypothetical protein